MPADGGALERNDPRVRCACQRMAVYRASWSGEFAQIAPNDPRKNPKCNSNVGALSSLWFCTVSAAPNVRHGDNYVACKSCIALTKEACFTHYPEGWLDDQSTPLLYEPLKLEAAVTKC